MSLARDRQNFLQFKLAEFNRIAITRSGGLVLLAKFVIGGWREVCYIAL
jgi:hypothetical protein